jgi:hypothetical protein
MVFLNAGLERQPGMNMNFIRQWQEPREARCEVVSPDDADSRARQSRERKNPVKVARMSGLAPAGEVLSCDATRMYPKKRNPPRVAGRVEMWSFNTPRLILEQPHSPPIWVAALLICERFFWLAARIGKRARMVSYE